MNEKETYYEILKVERKASLSEISAAYHAARSAFSKDSVATYSLLSNEETQEIVSKLEEAYQTLSNLARKQDYDRMLALNEANLDGTNPPLNIVTFPNSVSATASMKAAQSISTPAETNEPSSDIQTSPSELASASDTQDAAKSDDTTATNPVPNPSSESSPTLLNFRSIREKAGLTIEEVARTTKIPTKFLLAIEKQDHKHYPARVYLQGFIKNIAKLYRLDPETTVRTFFENLATEEKSG